MTAEQLAKLVVLVLNVQKKYFASHDREDLIKSKALEAQLRTAANGILANVAPVAVQEKMF